MAGELTIDVLPRDAKGKNSNRRLRAEGQVPAVVYGLAQAPVTIQVDRRSVVNLLKAGSGENTVFLLRLQGSEEQRHTMIRELQVDPIDRKILHIDFQRINLSDTVRVKIPIEIVGVAVGVKTDGGMMDFITRELEVECLPTEIPPFLELEVERLGIGDTVEAGTIALPPGMVLVDEPDRVIVAISQPQAGEEAEKEDEDALLLGGGRDEPEVIGKGRDDDEGDAESEG